jgi:hypothetical protein
MRFAWMATHRLFVKNQKQFHFDDLEKRRARFGEIIIDFAKSIPRNPITDRIINQSGGIATTGGATMLKRMIPVSKKEFLECIGTCKKEARETKYFLRMAVRAVPESNEKARNLWIEAKELHLIFATIWRSGKQKKLTNDKGNSNDDVRIGHRFSHSCFVINWSFVRRHLSFLPFIGHSSFC